MNVEQPSPGPSARPGERGVAAIELALVMPVIATLLLATFDAATVARRAFEVQTLAEAGAKAVTRLQLLPAPSSNTSGSGHNLPPPTPVTPGGSVTGPILLDRLLALPPQTLGQARLFWGCGGVPAPAGRTACADGSPLAPYAEVDVAGDVDRLVRWPGVLLPDRVEGRALVRLG